MFTSRHFVATFCSAGFGWTTDGERGDGPTSRPYPVSTLNSLPDSTRVFLPPGSNFILLRIPSITT
ncbi:hypothetical protein ACRALDRAFT_208229 [Sodiomyces alcalophilus JCM 7366]|uniref:uncharacterized protein n=1 Tax=Sodiomyces alcalophilus JCM 7366 TaxID=591952 RepID=UPI0039B4FCE6